MKINITLELDKSQVEGMALLAKFSNALGTSEDALSLLTDKFYIYSIGYSTKPVMSCDIKIKNITNLNMSKNEDSKEEELPEWWHEEHGKEYICSMCKGQFIAEWSEEEAKAESKELFGEIPQDEQSQVCDDCFKKLDFNFNKSK